MVKQQVATDRLVVSPVFILSPVRSGSTLLRCLLNSHPEICAPHELHLRHLHVGMENEYIELAVETAGLTVAELEHMLWDRLLHWFLTASGKRLVVDKSPSNIWMWRRLAECWPSARFIILRRHPAAIIDSIVRANDGRDANEATRQLAKVIGEIEAAAASLPNALHIRYEALTASPTTVCQRICEVLGVTFTPTMLDYGRHDHGPFQYGIGDWSTKIRSGKVQPARPELAWSGLSHAVQKLCRRWDYEPPPSADDDRSRWRRGR